MNNIDVDKLVMVLDEHIPRPTPIDIKSSVIRRDKDGGIVETIPVRFVRDPGYVDGDVIHIKIASLAFTLEMIYTRPDIKEPDKLGVASISELGHLTGESSLTITKLTKKFMGMDDITERIIAYVLAVIKWYKGDM